MWFSYLSYTKYLENEAKKIETQKEIKEKELDGEEKQKYVETINKTLDTFKDIMLDADVTTIKDADNNFHPNITKSQMELIWKSIVLNGESLLQEKWGKENEIKACTTIEQLEAIHI